MARIILVRHGRTFAPGDLPRRIGNRSDLALTDEGEREAEALAAALSGQPIRAIWSGRLVRSRQTASILAAKLRIARGFLTVRLLDEIDHGVDENRTDAEIVSRIGAENLALWDQHLIAPEGWELDLSARERGWRRIARVLSSRPESELIIAVGSQGAIRLAVQALGASGTRPAPKMKPGHYGILSLGSGHPPAMIEWDRAPTGQDGNDRQHNDTPGQHR